MIPRAPRCLPPLRRCLFHPRSAAAAVAQHQRLFHASPRYRAEDGGFPNHYETLEVQSNASPTEIKKQFYKLSKSHHPDRNPNDPEASTRFVKISAAYAILGSEEKRQRYDRDFLRANPPAAHHYPSGSYSSSGASYSGPGGRPASGLSKRRTQFKGPPPSFFRSGGWGNQGAKRAESASRASHAHERASAAQGDSTQDTPPGTGPSGFTQGFSNDVPHFDRDGHFRTQDAVERNKVKRRKGVPLDELRDTGPSMLFNFILMSGVLTLIFGVSGALMGEGAQGRTKKKQAV